MKGSTNYRHENSPLLVKGEKFAARIIRMVQYLEKNNKYAAKPLLNQILRSGTSIVANIGESQFAQTPADFVTKLHISLKEANETRRWLNVFYAAEYTTAKEHESMSKDLSEIIAILISSINTIKRNQLK